MKKNPICYNKKLIDEWNWDKNNPLGLSPDKISCGSSKKIWWKCKNNHEWQATPGHRTCKNKPTSCPKCAALLRAKKRQSILREKENITILFPDLLNEWDYEKNIVSPDTITKGSSINLWWMCSYGHHWQSPVGNRIKGHGCPYCSGRLPIKGVTDLQTINPPLAKEWNYHKNGTLTPNMVSYGSTKKVWWICKNGHEWIASICNRNKNRKCPICSKYRHISLPEKTLSFYLSKIFNLTENIKINNQLELDLFLPQLNLGIEYDGKAWHNNLPRDLKKDEFCKKNNITLIRIREYGLPLYETSAFLIQTQKPDSSLIFMEPVVADVIKHINHLFNLNLNIDININRDYFSILSLIEKFELENSLALQFPELLSEWDYEKNKGLRPNSIAKGSSKKVWWLCPNGHEWKTSIANRTNDKNRNQCPYCQKKKTIIGVNDIVTLQSSFLVDWDYSKNNDLPINFMEHSGKIVWWKCHKCGFEWKSTIDSRSKHGCRYCSRKEGAKHRRRAVKNIDTGEIFESAKDAGLKYNIKDSLIQRVCLGKRKTSGGYRWEYISKEKD